MKTIEKLRGALKGRVIEPGDEDYDAARRTFYGGIDRRPAYIVRVAGPTDVAKAIGFARDAGLELAVRSGGHSVVGHCVTDGGVVIDLHDMRELTVDAAARTAWAETGLTASDYTQATHEYGLGTGFGDTGSVGLGGITLGGGVGYLSRKQGLTIDNLLAADIVTADGQLIRADSESHPDLFWAIRGGGGNFGVATRFQYRLHDLATVYGGMLILPATTESIAAFVAACDAAPRELSAIGNVMPAPPMPFLAPEQVGKRVIMILMVHAGSPDDAERAVAPFRAIATPLADMVRPMPYPEIYPPEDPNYRPFAAARNMLLDRLDERDAGTIMEHLSASTANFKVAQIRVLGGAVADVPNDATAYAHRDRRIMVNVAAFIDHPDQIEERETWADNFWKALQNGEPAAYVNFLTTDGDARLGQAYPKPTLDRLAAIKARYDPENIFRLNQNIAPAAS